LIRPLLSVFVATAALALSANPGQPALLAPEQNVACYVEHPDFLWQAVDGAAAYEIQIATDRAFATIVAADRVEIPRYVPLRALMPADFFWRVRAVAIDGAQGAWSDTHSYQLRSPTHLFRIGPKADLTEIRRIVAQAAAVTPARVEFAAGATYRVKPSDSVLALSHASDLIIDGNDALVIIENPSGGFVLLDQCQRMTVRGFRVDYDPLPHTVGRVEAVEVINQRTIVVLRPEPGYPDFDAPHVRENSIWGVVLDSAPERRGWMKAGSPLVLNVDAAHAQRSAAGLYRLPVGAHGKDALAAGDRLIVFARNGGKSFAGVSRSTDVTFDRVIAYACPAGHFSFIGGSRLKVLASGSRLRDRSRWFAGNADGVHVRAALVGPWIEGCTFEGIGDDGVALYTKGMIVTRQLSANAVKVEREFMDLEAGETFRIFDPRDGTLIGDTFTVARATRSATDATVEFTPALPSGCTLTTDAARDTRSDQLFTMTKRNALFMIRNNQFTGIRRYGTVFRSADGVVKNNRYAGTSNAAIATINEPDSWHNGLASQRILIVGNTIDQCAFEASSTNVGSIHVLLRKLGGGQAPERLYRRITIANNTITNWSQRAISLQNAEDCAVVGNMIRSTLASYPLAAGEHYGIFLNNVRRTPVTGNDLSGEHRPLTTAIRVLPEEATSMSDNRLPQ